MDDTDRIASENARAQLYAAVRRLLTALERPWARGELLDAMKATREALDKAEGRP